MDEGILFEITPGLAKTNLIKNSFLSQYCTLFSEIVFALDPTLQRLLL